MRAKRTTCARLYTLDWIGLDTVVDANTINTYKSRLDKHCLNQDVVYNFYAELLTGTGGALN